MKQIDFSPISILIYFTFGALLFTACWTDFVSRKIPNKLIFFGILTGIAFQSLLPNGLGLFRFPAGALGSIDGFYGFAIGLAVFMPLYFFRAMGAGDVKLMAMIGVFLGPKAILGAALMTLLAGGVMAIIVAIWTRNIKKVLENVHAVVTHTMINAVSGEKIWIAPINSTIKIPYAFAITTGTIIQLILIHNRQNII